MLIKVYFVRGEDFSEIGMYRGWLDCYIKISIKIFTFTVTKSRFINYRRVCNGDVWNFAGQLNDFLIDKHFQFFAVKPL